jgi:hypothetical protein
MLIRHVASAYWFNWVQRDSTQETLISENRVFIQTNSHGTFLWILMPVSATLASKELLRLSPKSRSLSNILSDIFSAYEGGVAAPQGILTATFSAGPVHGSPATPSGCREKGHAHKWRLPLCQGLRGTPDSMVSDVMSRRWARLWVLAWVYIPCGDLTTSVIHTVTLGLAY